MRMPPKGLLTLRSRGSLASASLDGCEVCRVDLVPYHQLDVPRSSARSLFGGMLRSVVGNTSRGMRNMECAVWPDGRPAGGGDARQEATATAI